MYRGGGWEVCGYDVPASRVLPVPRTCCCCAAAGTFVLTDEPVLEPPARLAAALRARGVDAASFVTLRHGEARVFGGAPLAASAAVAGFAGAPGTGGGAGSASGAAATPGSGSAYLEEGCVRG